VLLMDRDDTVTWSCRYHISTNVERSFSEIITQKIRDRLVSDIYSISKIMRQDHIISQ
jgi:hypothetical protein